MQKIIPILCSALALSMVSCGGLGSKSSADTDTATETVADTTIPIFTLSSNGVGDIVLGMPTTDIPESIAGLYDRVEKYEGKSIIGYSFVLDSIETLSAEDTDFDGKINLIALRGDSPLKAATGNGFIHIGMLESNLLDPKGDIHITKEDGTYRIGDFKVESQDGKVSEIYIEWSPSISDK